MHLRVRISRGGAGDAKRVKRATRPVIRRLSVCARGRWRAWPWRCRLWLVWPRPASQEVDGVIPVVFGDALDTWGGACWLGGEGALAFLLAIRIQSIAFFTLSGWGEHKHVAG